MNEDVKLSSPLPELFARGTTAEGWKAKRRPELLKLFTELMYGEAPPAENPKASQTSERAGEGFTLRTVRLHTGPLGPLTVQLTLPRTLSRTVPCFIALNFDGNEATITGPKAWSLAEAARRGYAVLTACYEDLAPDRKDAPLYESRYRALSLWAWGYSRLADWALSVPELDDRKLIALGHSRLGKATLLAGARDERFAAVIPHQSGCGGAAPSRGTVGEPVPRINAVFPHWFSDSFKRYNERTHELPFDQHCLLACVAPRPVLLTNALEDTWANPEGQKAMLEAAAPAFALLGAEGKTHYKLRPGKHSMAPEDWPLFLDFAERALS